MKNENDENWTDRTNGTNRSDETSRSSRTNLIPPHGGYRNLKSYQNSVLIHDLTVEFCNRFVEDRTNRPYGTNRTWDQMTQAARSGKQNIAEGSQASGTSKKTEIKLINVARASQEELLIDFEDFLRQKGLRLWRKDDPRALKLRIFWRNRSHPTDGTNEANRTDLINRTYRSDSIHLADLGGDPEEIANAMICLIHQTNFLLDRLIMALERDFLEKGGFTERLYRERSNYRDRA